MTRVPAADVAAPNREERIRGADGSASTQDRTNRAADGRTRRRCPRSTGVRKHRFRVPRWRTEVSQRGPASQFGEPEKKGYVGCSVTCPLCEHAAKFHSYQSRRLLTVHGEVRLSRAYYYCGRCHQSYLPYDEVLGLQDEISPGLLPLLCLAGTLLPFTDAAEDVLKRFSGVRVSASTVLRRTQAEGERLRAQLKEGRMVEPTQPELKWTTPRPEGQPAAYVGLDAFSVPMQGIGAGKAEHRMLYTALLYTPEKEHSRYLVDFELDALAEQVRWQARALGIAQVSDLIAVTDGGNGLEEALQRHLADNVTTILDWYHAVEHLCDFAKVWHARDEQARQQWAEQAQGILYEQEGRPCWHCYGSSLYPQNVGGGRRGVAEVNRLFREQSPSHGLSELPSEGLGHWEWSDGSGLQDHRRTSERFGDALGGGWCGDGGRVACVICQRRQSLGRLLGATPPRRCLKSPK